MRVQPRNQEQMGKANARVLEKQEERKRKIKEKGIDYVFEGHVSTTQDLILDRFNEMSLGMRRSAGRLRDPDPRDW